MLANPAQSNKSLFSQASVVSAYHRIHKYNVPFIKSSIIHNSSIIFLCIEHLSELRINLSEL